jgi:hypothetical protein
VREREGDEREMVFVEVEAAEVGHVREHGERKQVEALVTEVSLQHILCPSQRSH